MDYFKIILSSVFSIAFLFFITKIIGNRQMSQFSMFDYINGITVGSIAAEAATNLDKNPLFPFIAMAVYATAGIVLPYISNKNLKVRYFLEGRPCVLFDHEKFYTENMKRQRIDVDEILSECRYQGYFDIKDIDTILLEHNGKISVLPKSEKRNTIPSDFNIKPEKDCMAQVVIYEGIVLNENLKHTGNNDVWLNNQLADQKTDLKDVFIGMCDGNNKLNIYRENRRNIM